MKTLARALRLRFKMDLRSKSLLITYYIVPLIFYLFMGGILTSVMPEMKHSLIPAMLVMGISMGSFLGLPVSLLRSFRSEVLKLYQVSAVPFALPLLSAALSAFLHLLLFSLVITLTAPFIFGAQSPEDPARFLLALLLFLAVSVLFGCVLGLAVKEEGRLNMIAQLLFLPSILLSGIMLPLDVLPAALQALAKCFPAYHGFRFMLGEGSSGRNLLILACFFAAGVLLTVFLLKVLKRSEKA